VLEIARLYAVQHAIGKGVGSALMSECIRFAEQLKKKTICLAVWEKNEQAIKFYLKWGFEKTGEEDFILGDDVQRDWTMEKNMACAQG
jgi:ribosomal protein S18 acetylase RimI-like enzyme